MATKGIWQLEKLTLRYCQHGGSSRYVREFLKDPKFAQFAKENPQLEIHTELKNGRHPVVIGDYITTEQKVCDIKNQNQDWILAMMTRLRNTSGRKMTAIKKPVKSSRPTIQGLWEQNIDSSAFTIEHRM